MDIIGLDGKEGAMFTKRRFSHFVRARSSYNFFKLLIFSIQDILLFNITLSCPMVIVTFIQVVTSFNHVYDHNVINDPRNYHN